MKDRTNHLSLDYIGLIEEEVRLDATMIRGDFKAGLDQTVHTEDDKVWTRL